QLVLGEIAAQHIENRLQIRVERRLNLGGTLLAHQALVAGQIDLYPEYTGTALSNVLRLPYGEDAAHVAERVRQEYERRFHLLWLSSLGFENGFAMAVRGADARQHHLETLSDAAHYAPGWRLGAGYEFLGRPDGYPALVKTYHLPFKGAPRSMDLGLVYRALTSGEVDMAAGSQTDGQLAAADVTVLRDDLHAFPPYEAAYVVRPAVLEKNAGLRGALAELSGKFSEKTMRELNRRVDLEHEPVTAVARSFLEQAGLRKPARAAR
ncbi:MAG TPA: glycine betaine ABC transporter substrate-binding protein, partial [Bryobacteraceae bacterium]|nr:glycine betaine ABC transporter substrate-binding protein [Bryobacteraceae bacterium]